MFLNRKEIEMEKILRIVVTLIGAALGYPVANLIMSNRYFLQYIPNYEPIVVYIGIIICFGLIFFILYPFILNLLRTVTRRLDIILRNENKVNLFGQLFGLIIGLILAFLFSAAFNYFPVPGVQWIITSIIYVVLGYIGWSLPRYHHVDIAKQVNWLRRLPEANSTPRVTRKKDNTLDNAKVLDTSVIIDGRIYDIIKTQFVEGPFLIPVFVLNELQLISDSSNDLKRSKGRRGLDIVSQLQDSFEDKIIISEIDYPEIREVDSKLVKMAKTEGYKIITNDYNLNKVASVQGVEILNINDLANAVKISVLPGEVLNVSLIKEGKEPGQAVAYLKDGTMIVVDNGRDLIGKDMDVEVTSALQTSAGRMIFAKIKRS